MLNFKKFGTDGDVLIILHGLFGSLDNWQGIAQALSDQYIVFIVDQRNHGKSDHFDEHNYALMASDLLEFMDQQDIHSAHLLGHSMGGKTVMQFALNYPDRLEKLIVADISPRYYAPHHQTILKALNSVDLAAVESRDEVSRVISENISNPSIVQFLMKGLARTSESGFRWKFNLKVLTEQIDNIGEALDGHAYITNPTLVLKGDRSDYILKEDEDLFEEMFPQLDFAVISNAGHWLHAENPKDFISEVLSFLN